MKKKALVLVNLGTPDAPKVSAVRKYLSQFLNDRRVIDLPWLLQKILVNLIIVPFRASKSTKLYQQLWTDKGSPLAYHLSDLVSKLQTTMGEDMDVFGAMRYGNPSLRHLLKQLKEKDYEELVFLPMFPQYASSTTGSVFQYTMSIMKRWNALPSVRFVNQFYHHPAFIEAFSERIKSLKPKEFNHVLFSFHGLPLSQINSLHPDVKCEDCRCELKMPEYGALCYRATCYETARLLAAASGILNNEYSVAFQSRLTKNWLSPFADDRIVGLAKSNVKKVLVVAPAFVADCLETTVEIGLEYKELFEKNGGTQLTLVESLNSSDIWVKSIARIVS